MTLVALGLAVAGHAAQATTYYSVQTDITGAQTGIDSASTSTWSFTTGQGWSFGGGSFEMKTGSQTSANITLSVYEGTNFTGPSVGSISMTTSEFCGGSAPCQSFAVRSFTFTNALVLEANKTYFVDLTSTAGTSGSQQYFIKGTNSSLSFVDDNGDPIPSGYITSITDSGGNTTTTAPPTPAPEPATFGIVALGTMGLAALRRRRR